MFYYQKERFIFSLMVFALFAVFALFFPIGEGEAPAEETQYYEELEAAATEKFVLNIATQKVHLPSCEVLSKTTESNKYYILASVEYLQQNGYIKCFSCNPF